MKCYTLVHKLALIQLSLDNPIYRIVCLFRILYLRRIDITLLTKIILSFLLSYYRAYWLLWDWVCRLNCQKPSWQSQKHFIGYHPSF